MAEAMQTFENEENVMRCPNCESTEMVAEVEMHLDFECVLRLALTMRCKECSATVGL